MCCAQRCMDTSYMYDLMCGWYDVLFFTKFYLKSIRSVIPIYIVRDDYELSKIFDLTMQKGISWSSWIFGNKI